MKLDGSTVLQLGNLALYMVHGPLLLVGIVLVIAVQRPVERLVLLDFVEHLFDTCALPFFLEIVMLKMILVRCLFFILGIRKLIQILIRSVLGLIESDIIFLFNLVQPFQIGRAHV